MSSFPVVGADIGGTHITAGLVDLTNRTLIPGSMFREKLNSRASAGEILDAWASTLQKVRKNISEPLIGLAIPGPFDYEEGICLIKDQAKYDNLFGVNVRKEL